MEPVVTTTTQPAATTTTAPAATGDGATTTAPAQTVVQRVSQIKEPTTTAPVATDTEITYDPKVLEALSPEARQQAEAFIKSVQGDYTRKTQVLAEQRKTLEASAAEPQTWTAERLQQMLKDPGFLQIATQALSHRGDGKGGVQIDGQQFTEEEWSVLSDAEKAQLTQNQNGVKVLQKQMYDLHVQQEDTVLQTKYASYNPEEVNKLSDDLVNNRVRATREHLYQVLNYERDINRAYELGKTDMRDGIVVKSGGSTDTGGTVTQTSEVPEKGKNESGPAYFKRLALRRIGMLPNAAGAQK